MVAVYSDYLCPICGVFEQTNGATLDELRQSGEIVLEYHPVSILDRKSGGTAYSTRSATAAALVAATASGTPAVRAMSAICASVRYGVSEVSAGWLVNMALWKSTKASGASAATSTAAVADRVE